ncbi:MAG TPA: type II toxin-antitoxin system VapC family toxin [Coriobacteriia bacterium]
MSDGTYVLDSSVGVKWFRDERGCERAAELLHDSTTGTFRVVVPAHFAHEVLSVVGREGAASDIVRAWKIIVESRIDIVPLSDDVVAEAARQYDRLGCSFYDALAPAVASLFQATLVSADFKAHALYPGVELIG